jgi:hypothetical protein
MRLVSGIGTSAAWRRTLLILFVCLAGGLASAPGASAAGGTLSGTVTGPDGAPFDGGLQVSIYRDTGSGGWAHFQGAFIVGDEFSFSVPAGTFRACVSPTDDTLGSECWDDAHELLISPPAAATDIPVAEGATVAIDVAIDDSAGIAGTVTDSGGGALADTEVWAYAFDRDAGAWAKTRGNTLTDPTGSYLLTGLHPGAYRVCAEPRDGVHRQECWQETATVDGANDVDAPEGAVAQGIDMTLSPGATISGKVLDAAGEPTYAQATAFALDSATGQWKVIKSESTDVISGGARTGSYAIRGLEPGTYRVCFFSYELVDECWDDAETVEQAKDIVVNFEQTVTGVTASLDPGGVIEGTVSGGYVGAQGEVAADVYRLVAGDWELVGAQLERASTNQDFPYRIVGLATGTYRVCLRHEDPEFVPGFAPECYGGTPTVQSGADIPVTAPQTATGIDIDLDAPSLISGRVLAAAEPVAVDLYTGSGQLIAGSMTAPDGRYVWRDLPAGSYKLAFNRAPDSTRLAAEFYRHVPERHGLAGATVVSLIGATAATGVDGTLDAGASITGRVVDGSGAAIAGCRLEAYTDDSSLVTRWAESGADGTFDVGGLSTGSYKLRIGGGSCALAPQHLHYDTESPNALAAEPAGADEIAVTLGAATALPRVLGEVIPVADDPPRFGTDPEPPSSFPPTSHPPTGELNHSPPRAHGRTITTRVQVASGSAMVRLVAKWHGMRRRGPPTLLEAGAPPKKLRVRVPRSGSWRVSLIADGQRIRLGTVRVG